jgi:hypothetical protein
MSQHSIVTDDYLTMTLIIRILNPPFVSCTLPKRYGELSTPAPFNIHN